MHELTKLIQEDMKPALGVTEPGAIAFAVATARSYLSGELKEVVLKLNSGIYKNAYTCGIPNSSHLGNVYAAALGAVAGRPEKGLESLADVTEEDNRRAEALVGAGIVKVHMEEITSRIFIEAAVRTEDGEAAVTIRDSHTNIVRITVNGRTVLSKEEAEAGKEVETPLIHSYTLREMYEYITTVDGEEHRLIKNAHRMNYELFLEGLESPRTSYGRYLLEKNGGKIISKDEQATASLLCGGAIEARVMGLDKPAMSITGSGAHGIIATLPLYAVTSVRDMGEEALVRATALAYLICMYIKEYSGKLSAFCGCGIAAGSGMACGLVYLNGGGVEAMERCLCLLYTSPSPRDCS